MGMYVTGIILLPCNINQAFFLLLLYLTRFCIQNTVLPMLAVINAGCMLYTGEELLNSKKNVAKVTKIAGSI